jgi:hypothetical protein
MLRISGYDERPTHTVGRFPNGYAVVGGVTTGFRTRNLLSHRQEAVPSGLRGRVFTMLDVTWSAIRLLSLAAGAVLADAIRIRPLC